MTAEENWYEIDFNNRSIKKKASPVKKEDNCMEVEIRGNKLRICEKDKKLRKLAYAALILFITFSGVIGTLWVIVELLKVV